MLEITGGEVFHDGPGEITELRARLAWYPDDLWRYVVAADWARLAQELPLMGRVAARGDEVGSRVIAGRLVRAAMHLGFLLERRWPPYPKWLGTLFRRLPRAGGAHDALGAAVSAATWQERQSALCAALDHLHHLQLSVGLPTAERAWEPFFDRPFCGVPDAAARLLLQSVEDPDVRNLPAGVGSVEQWIDSVDVLTHTDRRIVAAEARSTGHALHASFTDKLTLPSLGCPSPDSSGLRKTRLWTTGADSS